MKSPREKLGEFDETIVSFVHYGDAVFLGIRSD